MSSLVRKQQKEKNSTLAEALGRQRQVLTVVMERVATELVRTATVPGSRSRQGACRLKGSGASEPGAVCSANTIAQARVVTGSF